MTKFKKVLFGLFGLFVFVALPLAHAQDAQGSGDPSQKWHSGQRFQQIFSQLGLTDDQKRQLEANKQQHRAKIKIARQQVKADKEALRGELMKPVLDMPRISAIQDQIKALQSQMEDDNLSSILAVRAILTPDQFLKFISLMHRHKD